MTNLQHGITRFASLLAVSIFEDRQYAEAEKVFRRDLQLNPNNPRSLFGLNEALKGQKKKSETDQLPQRFEEAWKGADVEISVQTL
jgi:cytochrome c-type biogenesis protein CcmH/NrfG